MKSKIVLSNLNYQIKPRTIRIRQSSYEEGMPHKLVAIYRGINICRQYIFTEIYRKEKLVSKESLEEKRIWELELHSDSLTLSLERSSWSSY